MDLQLDVQRAVVGGDVNLPGDEDIHRWAAAAVRGRRDTAELSVRIVDAQQSAELNRRYRHKEGPTNVLSFPFDAPAGVDLPLLGDLVICAEVVESEARQQGKPLMAHWAHMVVHGTLHLLGFDHIESKDAAVMEQQEINILRQLGVTNPYEVSA